ncbi:MAG TPA: beta-N-acetylhexosaminidase, partial [Cyclobacteriaceae bacterium]
MKRGFKNITGVILVCISSLLLQCSQQDKAAQNNSPSVIPKPTTVAYSSGYFTIDKNTTIAINSEELAEAANYLTNMIAEASSFAPEIKKQNGNEEHHTIVLQLVKQTGNEQNNKEAYSLKVTTDQVIISASGSSGIFYGIQTLRQLLPAAIEVKNKKTESWQVPVLSIEDNPQFAWRGMHLDVSRHFFSVEFVKTFI